MEGVEDNGTQPPAKTQRLDDRVSSDVGSSQTASLQGAPPWAGALYNQMTLMLKRQEEMNLETREWRTMAG
eukprot:11559164-Prorocentrum_lima.AAC.1